MSSNSPVNSDDIILFLDIDGVLHPADAAYLDSDKKPTGKDLFRWLPKLQEALVNFPQVKIVIHSSWRWVWETESEMRSYLPEWLNKRAIAITNPEIRDRHLSIVDYIYRNNISKYVILDDDGNAFPYQFPGIVYCKSNQGLSRQSTYKTLIEKLTAFANEIGTRSEDIGEKT